MRITRSRGGGMGRTPRSSRNRPPTPRASGATTVLRIPSPNRARRSVSRESTTALPTRDEQVDDETPPSQENQPDTVAPSAQEVVQPQTDQQEHGDPGMTMDNLLQTNQDLQHPIGQDLLFHPTSRKPERMTVGHMKQEKSQVTQHIQDSGIRVMW
jgi:hypothetical protein